MKLRPPSEPGIPLDVFCEGGECTAKVKGVVTARGGDHVDWYSLATPCTERVRIALDWEIPREGSELALSFWVAEDGDRGRGYVKTLRQQQREDDEDDEGDNDEGRIRILHTHVRPGTHVIGVHARGESGAGAYTLEVIEDIAVCDNGVWTANGWLPSGDVILPRPENLVPPRSKDSLVAITTAGMARQDRDDARANEPTIVLDASDPRVVEGARGMLVDDRGRRVRNSELEITATWSPEGSTARFGSAKFVAPGWFRRRIELGWSYWFATIIN